MKNNVYFISDLHFSHANSLYFKPKRRKLAGITLDELRDNSNSAAEKFDKWLIKKWNSTIKKDDMVYIIGDFCLANNSNTERLLNKLNGKKYLINGNHDKSCRGLERYFMWKGDIKEVKFNHQQFPFIDENETFCVELCHFPMTAWNRRPHGTCMVHGHVHGAMDKINRRSKELRLDVGLDGKLSGYEFISLEKIYNEFKNIIKRNTKWHNRFVRLWHKMGFSGGTEVNTFQEYIDWLMKKQGYRI